MAREGPKDAPRGPHPAPTVAVAIALLALGGWLLLLATGSSTLCIAGGCSIPTDAWEPWRLGGALLFLTAGSATLLTAIWPR